MPTSDKNTQADGAKNLRAMGVVYAKRPFGSPEHVLQYLGNYIHRIAISNHRLLNLTEEVCAGLSMPAARDGIIYFSSERAGIWHANEGRTSRECPVPESLSRPCPNRHFIALILAMTETQQPRRRPNLP